MMLFIVALGVRTLGLFFTVLCLRIVISTERIIAADSSEVFVAKLFSADSNKSYESKEFPLVEKSDWPLLYYALYSCGLSTHKAKKIDFGACLNFANSVKDKQYEGAAKLVAAYAIKQRGVPDDKILILLQTAASSNAFDFAYFPIRYEIGKLVVSRPDFSWGKFIDYLRIFAGMPIPDYMALFRFITTYKDGSKLVWNLGSKFLLANNRPFGGEPNFIQEAIGYSIENTAIKDCHSKPCEDQRKGIEDGRAKWKEARQKNQNLAATQRFVEFVEMEIKENRIGQARLLSSGQNG